ncbi:hypothetical protein LTS18_004594, partial [Coniosporium uncinatum]
MFKILVCDSGMKFCLEYENMESRRHRNIYRPYENRKVPRMLDFGVIQDEHRRMIRQYCLEIGTHYDSENNSNQLDGRVAWRHFKLLFPRVGPGHPDERMYEWLWNS